MPPTNPCNFLIRMLTAILPNRTRSGVQRQGRPMLAPAGTGSSQVWLSVGRRTVVAPSGALLAPAVQQTWVSSFLINAPASHVPSPRPMTGRPAYCPGPANQAPHKHKHLLKAVPGAFCGHHDGPELHVRALPMQGCGHAPNPGAKRRRGTERAH